MVVRVPILSRPEGPELLCYSLRQRRILMFQSSPGPKAQSYRLFGVCQLSPDCSNPLQARRPRATKLHIVNPLTGRVPILSRPEGPELHNLGVPDFSFIKVPILSRPEGPELPRALCWCYFLYIEKRSNPLQARRPRATPLLRAATRAIVGFQSSPGPKAQSYVQ